MLRFIFLFCLMIIGSFGVPITSAVAQPDLSKIKVITSFYEPYSFRRGEQIEGEAVEQARKLFAELNYTPPIQIYPWPRAYEIALNQPNILLFSVARTPEREDLFHWVGEIVGFDVYLYRHKKRNDLVINRLADVTGLRIGALNKDVKGQYLRSKGITPLTLNDEENGIQMILGQRIDLLPMDRVSMDHRLRKKRLKPDALIPALKLTDISKPLYIAFSRNTDPEIVRLFQKAHKRAFTAP